MQTCQPCVVKKALERREFIQLTGAAIGVPSLAGFASGRSESGTENKLVVRVSSISDATTRYVAAIAYNKETENIEGTILPVQLADNGAPKELGQPDSDEPNLYDIDNAVLEIIKDGFTDRYAQNAGNESGMSPASSSDSTGQETALWDDLRRAGAASTEDATNSSSDDGSVSVQAREETLLENVVKEISAGAKDAINRVGAYYITNPAGTRCNAARNKNKHHLAGASIDYEKNLNDLNAALIGAALGAILGVIIAPPLGGVAGAIVSSIVAVAINRLKDSSNITVAVRDWDNCLRSACLPDLRRYVSGRWMDPDTNLLRVGELPKFRNIHLENVALVKSGYRDVVRISP